VEDVAALLPAQASGLSLRFSRFARNQFELRCKVAPKKMDQYMLVHFLWFEMKSLELH